MLPLDLFRDRRFSVASGVITLTFFSMFGFFFLSTLYLQNVLGYSPLEAGLAGLPMAGAMIVVAPRSAALTERYGGATVMTGGFAVMAASLGMFTQVTTGTPYLVTAVGFVMLGAGLAATAAPASGMLMSAVPLDKAGVGSAVNDTTRQVGGALGVALLGSLLASVYRQDVRSGLAGSGAPDELVERASSTVQAGVAAGRGVGGELGDHIVTVAHSSFLSGYHLALLVAAGITLVGAAGVFRWLPARAAEPEPEPVDAPVGAGTAGDGSSDEPVAPPAERAVG
jgi:predicted MFS family arabinose efflux permease